MTLNGFYVCCAGTQMMRSTYRRFSRQSKLRVIEYDAGGTKLRQWGERGTGPGEFDVVHSIAIGPQGNIYVADRENGRLKWFDPRGKFLGQWKYGDGTRFVHQERLLVSFEGTY